MAKYRSVAVLAAISLLVGLVVSWPHSAMAAQRLPSGFIVNDIPTGLRPPGAADPGDLLTDFGFLPDDGGIISVGKNGRIMWAPADGEPRQIAWPTTHTPEDLGMAGLAIAPDYRTSRTIYTTRNLPTNTPGAGAFGLFRVSGWTVVLDAAGKPVGLTDERAILQITADSAVHGMTSVLAADDGTLWITIGDSSEFRWVDPKALRANDPTDPHGKLLHITSKGAGVPSNPYFDPAAPNSVKSLVYASGFRSPFRLSLDPRSGRPILGDVGWNTSEEVDLITPGTDYGWPCWETRIPTPGYRDLPQCAGRVTAEPLFTYPRSEGSSVTGGVVYTGTSYPADYRGRYFFGDYASKRVWTTMIDDRGEVVTPIENGGFGADIGNPVKFASMPVGGDIVYADIGTAMLRRIVYAPGNVAPSVSFTSTADPDTRAVRFDASATVDPNGDNVTYQWDFGDGTTAAPNTAPLVDHVYAPSVTSATATLTATDEQGATASRSRVIYPGNHPPVVTLTAPGPTQTFAVGDIVSASATAADSEDGPLSVTWTVNTAHCRTEGCHNHPGERYDGATLSLPFAGHPGDSKLEISVTAVDTTGTATSKTFVVTPRQRRITVQSSTPALFTIGDETTTSGLFTEGATLSVIAPQTAQDEVAVFAGWHDGRVDRARQLVVPAADLTFVADYSTPMDQRYLAEAPLRALLGAPTTVEQGDGQVRWREFANGRLYWTRAAGVHFTIGRIMVRHLALGGHVNVGVPLTDELPTWDGAGRFTLFEFGSIYWSPATDAWEIGGAIRGLWGALGWEKSALGYPTTNESGTPDGIGRFNHFQQGSIYWTPALGAHEIRGSIHSLWAALGWEKSALGYPTTNETGTPDGVGRFNQFQQGSIYWSPNTGAHEIRGAIRGLWAAMGWENSALGYPTSNETGTLDGVGRFNQFQYGSIYWSPRTGAHEVRGAIRNAWASIGWERSYLGYPTSDEFAIAGGRRSNFTGGYIEYKFATGATTIRRY
jgi:uncharacterized protein with LGFP repeats/glucose/arabinose dehydrogenase